MQELINKLNFIQLELKAPKNQRNNFGNYNYRSCEDILEGIKKVIKDNSLEVIVLLSDKVININNRYYIEANAKITDGKNEINSFGYAREEETKKGMDASQITGSASSYARKYALNGLFCIDDTKDADATNNHEQGKNEQNKQNQAQKIENNTNTSENKNNALKTQIIKLNDVPYKKGIFANMTWKEVINKLGQKADDKINDYIKWKLENQNVEVKMNKEFEEYLFSVIGEDVQAQEHITENLF